jgi:hypothetical protein
MLEIGLTAKWGTRAWGGGGSWIKNGVRVHISMTIVVLKGYVKLLIVDNYPKNHL